MKRNLLKQLRNEWRDNIWMVLELTIVVGIIWLLSTLFFVSVKGLFQPRVFDYRDVYTLNVKTVSKSSPYHVSDPEMSDTELLYADLQILLRRLRDNPNVEEVAIHSNGMPYNYSFSGYNIVREDIKDTVGYFGNTRWGSPEIVKVIGYESTTGKTPEQLTEILKRGEILISTSKNYQGDINEWIGRPVLLGGDSTWVYRVGDVIRNVRRNDFEESWGGTIIIPMTDPKSAWGQVALKLKSGHERRFKEDFKNNRELRSLRNIYLTDLTSLADQREGAQRPINTQLHTIETLMAFLLLTIFLGLLGTFWFRIQQRIGEIALRKVCGATKRDIFIRIISEGMILLLLAVVLASAILWPLSGTLTETFGTTNTIFLIFEGVAAAIVAVGIIISLWYPARKAMRIEPAIALKTE